MTDTIRVLIADDHAVVRQGLRLFLDVQPDVEVVGEAENGAAAVARTQELRPDVVVMDVVMPEVDGIEATTALRETAREVKVLALSTFSDDDLRAGLNTGDVIAEERGYFGRAVFVASRVADAAGGGQILVSEVTRNLAGDDGLQFVDRGAHRLKGLKDPHHLFEVVWSA